MVYTDFGTHPLFYEMDTGFFSGIKLSGHEADLSVQL
jgi:hypothetical protein